MTILRKRQSFSSGGLSSAAMQRVRRRTSLQFVKRSAVKVDVDVMGASSAVAAPLHRDVINVVGDDMVQSPTEEIADPMVGAVILPTSQPAQLNINTKSVTQQPASTPIPTLPTEILLTILCHLPAPHLIRLLRLSRHFQNLINHILLTHLPLHLTHLRSLQSTLHRRLTVEHDILDRTLLSSAHHPQSRDVDELRRYARPTVEVVGVMSALMGLAPSAPVSADPVQVYTAHTNFPGGGTGPPLGGVPRMVVGVAAFGVVSAAGAGSASGSFVGGGSPTGGRRMSMGKNWSGSLSAGAGHGTGIEKWRDVQGLMNQPGFKPWLKKLTTALDVLSDRKAKATLMQILKVAGGGNCGGGATASTDGSEDFTSASIFGETGSSACLTAAGMFGWKEITNTLAEGGLVTMMAPSITSLTPFSEAIQSWISLPPLTQHLSAWEDIRSSAPVARGYVLPFSPLSPTARPSSPALESSPPTTSTSQSIFVIQRLNETAMLCRKLVQSCGPAVKFLYMLLGISAHAARVRPLKRTVSRVEICIGQLEELLVRLRASSPMREGDDVGECSSEVVVGVGAMSGK
ncbi:hypothetical protein HDU97_002704 [Phlyctochytrium planicorne]|nr:hypothetical protein HDU97_002704 [Phlyctochytrium planicorne]